MAENEQQPTTPDLKESGKRSRVTFSKKTQLLIVCGVTALLFGWIALRSTGAKQIAESQRKAAESGGPGGIAVDRTQPTALENHIKSLEARRAQEEAARKIVQDTMTANVLAQQQSLAAAQAGSYVSPAPPPTPQQTDADRIKQAQKEREYKSLFASNVALSYRAQATTPAPVTVAPPPPVITRAAEQQEQEREEREDQVPRDTAPPLAERQNAHVGKLYRIFSGTVVETVLINRLIASFTGPVKTLLTTAIKSFDGQHVLIPAGTIFLGEAHKVADFGQERVAVTFDRAIMPDGYSLRLDGFKGLSQEGATGLKDKVNHHYVQIFGTSLALGVISAATMAGGNYGYNMSGGDALRAGISQRMSQDATHVLSKFLNIPWTVTIREGVRVKIFITDDLEVPSAENHRVQGDL